MDSVELTDTETFTPIPIESIIDAVIGMESVWMLYLDMQSKIFTMSKSEYEDLPAVALDALRIIIIESEKHIRGTKNARSAPIPV